MHMEEVVSFGLMLASRAGFPLPGFLQRVMVDVPLDEDFLSEYLLNAPPGSFVDIGANWGKWVGRMIKLREVYAFEPDPRMCAYMRMSLRGNPRFHLEPVALGDSEGLVDLNMTLNPGMNSILYNKHLSFWKIKVALKKLDSYNLNGIGVIKIDTEGYEMPVLYGAVETIRRNKPRLAIELHMDYKTETRKMDDFLKPLGYRWKIVHYRHGQPHVIADAVA